MKNVKLKELEEQYINLMVSIYEGTATNRQLLGFRQALKIMLDEKTMDDLVDRAATRADKVISNLKEMK